jgi:hypothetical protein
VRRRRREVSEMFRDKMRCEGIRWDLHVDWEVGQLEWHMQSSLQPKVQHEILPLLAYIRIDCDARAALVGVLDVYLVEEPPGWWTEGWQPVLSSRKDDLALIVV